MESRKRFTVNVFETSFKRFGEHCDENNDAKHASMFAAYQRRWDASSADEQAAAMRYTPAESPFIAEADVSCITSLVNQIVRGSISIDEFVDKASPGGLDDKELAQFRKLLKQQYQLLCKASSHVAEPVNA